MMWRAQVDKLASRQYYWSRPSERLRGRTATKRMEAGDRWQASDGAMARARSAGGRMDPGGSWGRCPAGGAQQSTPRRAQVQALTVEESRALLEAAAAIGSTRSTSWR